VFIIIEGPTCVGKTTFTARLYEYLKDFGPIRPLHRSRPEEQTRRWVLTDYVLSVEDYAPAANYTVLADRWHYGEGTYAPIYRPKTNKDGFGLLGVAGWRWTELFLMSRGALVIRLDADNQTLIDRLYSRGDDHVADADELVALAQSYRDLGQLSPTTARVINTTEVDVADLDLDEFYFSALQLEAAAKVILDVSPDYLGNPRPDILLVGDKRNITPRYGEETQLPFMPVDQSSGGYLLESLPNEFWPRVGIVNGRDMRGNLRELWEVLGRPRPVSLGNPAARSLIEAGFDDIEFTRLRHPAFTRRFEHFSQGQYGDDIVAAAELKGTYA
jgi:hypothetical protein